MAKAKTLYVCTSCGNESAKWMGKCINCGEWNTYKEIKEPTISSSNRSVKAKEITKLSGIKTSTLERIQTGIKELDKALGGGIVNGQVLLLAGEPGIGKSTMLLQIAKNLKDVLYVSGEESLSQIKHRTERLSVKADMSLIAETNIDIVLATVKAESAKSDLKAIFIDSVQTMYTESISSAPGSVGQVREVSLQLIRFAKKSGIPVILVGHVTKGGNVAGPATLMHMVDTVCWFEGESKADLRLVRIMKNRFGPTDEIGLFVMSSKGLVSMEDIDEYLLKKDRLTNVAGTVTSCVMEGSRTILVEVQALAIPTKLAIPRRVVQGIDSKRAELLIAVLTKHCKVKLYEFDVYINIVGGVKVRDTSLDLAVCAAVNSSVKDKPIKPNTAVIGEVGLLGDIRMPLKYKKYCNHLKKHGFSTIGPDDTQICSSLQKTLTSK